MEIYIKVDGKFIPMTVEQWGEMLVEMLRERPELRKELMSLMKGDLKKIAREAFLELRN